MQQISELDAIDLRILDLLQHEGRVTLTELGERVGLSTSPCSQRVKRLERLGVISGYHAKNAPAAAYSCQVLDSSPPRHFGHRL